MIFKKSHAYIAAMCQTSVALISERQDNVFKRVGLF